MKKEKKVAIKESVERALSQVLENLQIVHPSKKTEKAITKTSKILKNELKHILKKEDRKTVKSDRKSKTSSKSKSAKLSKVAE